MDRARRVGLCTTFVTAPAVPKPMYERVRSASEVRASLVADKLGIHGLKRLPK